MTRKRRYGSVKTQLLKKAQQSALTAIQTFNNPLVEFKSETFIVLMVIAWTYLLHAYYRDQGIEYRYYKQGPKRRRFARAKSGSYRYWELARCLECPECPLGPAAKKNLEFLLGLRHEIEHHLPPQLDDYFSGRYQACCVNFNDSIKKWFGDGWGIDEFLTYSIQFARLRSDQVQLPPPSTLPNNVQTFIARFEDGLTEDDLNSPQFSLRFLFVRKTVGKPGQADQVIEFVAPDSSLAAEINAQYLLKEVEKKKYRPGQIVEKMKAEGFDGFNMHHHTQLWKGMDAKNPVYGYGAVVAGGEWFWYDRWVDVVRQHCLDNRDKYSG